MEIEEIRRRRMAFLPDTVDEAREADEAINETLSRLPEDVREWALTKIVWFCPAEGNGVAAYFRFKEGTMEHVRDDSSQGESWWVFHIVSIAPHLFAAAREKQTWVMAHELAHHRLKHCQKNGEGGISMDAADAEADEQAREWGFRDPDKDNM
jgi:hypothetical protein